MIRRNRSSVDDIYQLSVLFIYAKGDTQWSSSFFSFFFFSIVTNHMQEGTLRIGRTVRLVILVV